MALDRNTLRERLQFYRELGVGPLYRREVSGAVLPEVVDVVSEELPVKSTKTDRKSVV